MVSSGVVAQFVSSGEQNWLSAVPVVVSPLTTLWLGDFQSHSTTWPTVTVTVGGPKVRTPPSPTVMSAAGMRPKAAVTVLLPLT